MSLPIKVAYSITKHSESCTKYSPFTGLFIQMTPGLYSDAMLGHYHVYYAISHVLHQGVNGFS